MKRAALLAIACISIGCRGIIGIEDREYVADGGEADATVNDANADGANPAATICLHTTGDCPPCCRNAYHSQSQRLLAYENTCLCAPGPNDCSAPCDAGPGCAISPQGGQGGGGPEGGGAPGPNQCGPCLDRSVTTSECADAAATCLADPACADIVVCLRSCFP